MLRIASAFLGINSPDPHLALTFDCRDAFCLLNWLVKTGVNFCLLVRFFLANW